MSKFHIMVKDGDEWDYFFKKSDYKGKTRNDLGQKWQANARDNAQQISKRKELNEVAVFYKGELVDLFIKGKLVEGREIKVREKKHEEGI